MRKLIVIFMFFISMKIVARHNVNNQDPQPLFGVECFIKSDDKKIKETTSVRVISKGKLINTIDVIKGKGEIELPLDNEYLLEFISEGFFVKRIAINTHIEQGVEVVPLLELTIHMVKSDKPNISKEDYDLLDFPVAYMAYDEKKGFYDINKAYSKILSKSIQDSEKKYLRENKNLSTN